MKKIVLLLFVTALLASCNRGEIFEIEGNLSDKSFDGEWIYLVPMVNAPVERVDSTVIRDGAFYFKSKVEIPEIYVIRGRPSVRLSLQELLVVKEPGKIQAFLGQNSSAHGTALNDSLQNWKSQKAIFDQQSLLLHQSLKNADADNETIISARLEELNAQKNSYNFSFVKNNYENIVGETVYRFLKGSFTEEQRKELETGQ